MLCCVVLCCVVLCCVVLCCVVLCCVVLCCAVLCCVVLCCVVLCGSQSLTYESIPGGYLSVFLVYWGMPRKSGGDAESIRSGRTMPCEIRELWLSMNTVPFRIVSEWTSTLIHIYACSSPSHTHVSHTYAGPHSHTHTYVRIHFNL